MEKWRRSSKRCCCWREEKEKQKQQQRNTKPCNSWLQAHQSNGNIMKGSLSGGSEEECKLNYDVNKDAHERSRLLQLELRLTSHEASTVEESHSETASEQVRWKREQQVDYEDFTHQWPNLPSSNRRIFAADKKITYKQHNLSSTLLLNSHSSSIIRRSSSNHLKEVQNHSPEGATKISTVQKPNCFFNGRSLAMIASLLLLIGLECLNAYQLTNNLIANNLPPKFSSSAPGQASNSEIVVRVKEGAASIGKLIYTLKGEDPDEDPLTFGVLGSMASDLLRIENVPGNQANVYLRKELDREITESYQVVITLTDGKLGRGNWITKSMLIIVEDVNDNYPVFAPHRTAISIREDVRVPLVVETIEASDQDEGRFGQVIYKLSELDDSTANSRQISSMFTIETIDGKGVISLVSPLDYEQKALYQLRILAIDRAIEQERLSASTSILISVEDCEDQPPMFTFVPSITRIPEDLPIGSPVVRVAAIDGDRGINNPIQYKLISVNGHEAGPERQLFSMSPDSGQIIVAHELNRESSSGSADQSLQVGATLGGRNQAASADSSAGSQPGSYVLQVRASELGGSSGSLHSVSTELTVILTDINDEIPLFSSGLYHAEILENSPPESLLNFVPNPFGSTNAESRSSEQQVLAKVLDRDQGTNGTFTLHLEGEHAHLFEVWPREATNEANLMIKIGPLNSLGLHAQQLLDYERNKVFKLTIVAKEKYAQSFADSRSSRAQLNIYLRDANDNYPQFESELYKVEIPENAIRGMHICAVKATDQDSGSYGTQGIRYTEIRGEKANKFKLDPNTGVITLKTNEHGFDREIIGQHHLIVEARDGNGSGNRNTTQLLIVLTDVNDQKPKFLLEQYEAFIYENEPDFQSPLQVQAIDADAPGTANSRITYSIVTGDPYHNFTIDPHTGRIRVRSSLQLPDGEEVAALQPGLDFERIAQKRDDARQFNLTIRATDSGLPEPLADHAQIIIMVYDKNDHAPVFSRNFYSKSIREDAKEGSQVIQVSAQDGDHSPSNSKITYRISSGGSDKFVIDSDTGMISVANGANLDIDRVVGGQRRTNYLLNIIAFDGSFGSNQKSSSALVNITIIDVNNKPPEFTTLGASRLPSNFPQSGSSTTSASNGLVSTPNQQLMVVYVNEDAPFGLVVTRVVAMDLDSSAQLRYSINRSEARNEDMIPVDPILVKDLFTIEPTDGTIKVARSLDRELFDQVKLRLQVEDIAAQTPDQVAHTYLLFKITDVNDNRPVFKKPVYKAVVNENSISGTSVITVTADDRDLNKTLKYSLDGAPEMLRLIRINPKSGEITVNDKIDRETFPMINVTVKAEDYGYPQPLTGSTQLHVTVRDENDNNPIFINSSQILLHHHHHHLYRHRSLPPTIGSAPDGHSPEPPLSSPGSVVSVREDAPIGYQVTYVRADDADIDNNGRVSYLLDAASSGGKFRIDRDSGVISVAGLLDREIQRQYSLIVEACDNYEIGYSTGESRRAFTQVNIQITDTNDNVPMITTNLQTLGGGNTNKQPGGSTLNSQSMAAAQPSLDDIMESPGPYEVALPECLFINEFQALNEPILTITATDADDPSTPNGQFDLSIVNNLPQNELFSLVLIPSSLGGGNSSPHESIVRASSSSIAQQSQATSIVRKPPADLSSFEERVSAIPHDNIAPGLLLSESKSSSIMEVQQPHLPSDKHHHLVSLAGFNVENVSRMKRSSLDTAQPNIEYQTPSPVLSSETLDSSASSSNSNIYSTRFSSASFQANRRSSPSSLARQQGVFVHQTDVTTEAPLALIPSATMSSVRHLNSHLGNQNMAEAGEQQVHLVVTKPLKERVGNYSILVRATDRGQSALSSMKVINICVQDVNNHAPVFLRPTLNHTIRVLENATLGSYVVQVEASDADHGLNGQVQYALKPTSIQNSNNDWQSFKIDRMTGIISTAKPFNRQAKKYYTLRVQAQDFGKPTTLASDIDINIIIVNSGQYQPEFDNQLQSLQFTENVAPGIEWVTLMATTNQDDDPALIGADQTPGANWLASPCYFIVDSDDQEQIFHLDRYTHRLTNQKTLDRERKANYTLLIQATNSCNKIPTRPVYTRALTSTTEASTNQPLPAGSMSSSQPQTTLSPISIDYRSSENAEYLKSGRSARAVRAGNEETVSQIRSKKAIEHQNGTSNQRDIYSSQFDSQASKLILDESKAFNQAAIDTLLSADKSLLKVFIKVKDVNDNAPRFTQRVYTGGLTTEADFGTIFMIVQAIDLDIDANSQVMYSIVKPIKKNLISLSNQMLQVGGHQQQNKSSLEASSTRLKRATQLSISTGSSLVNNMQAHSYDENSVNDIPMGEGDDLFVINPQTGEISLNFDPQKHMKGYFEFEVLANDTFGLLDSAKVFIYLLRQDQRVKFVLRLTPQELRQRLNKFRSVFGNITGAIVNIDSYKYYENHDGTVDKKKTSLYLHFVNPDDNTIIEVDKVLTLIDNNIEYLDELYKEFHVLSSEAAHLPLSSSALIDPIDQIRTGLLGVSSFLALILVLVIALCLNQRTRYERQLKAATVSAFGSSPLHLDPDYQSQANLPNTNLHSQDPNPIWMNGYTEQEWLGHGSKGLNANPNVQPNLKQHQIQSNQRTGATHCLESSINPANVAIEDADYLSSGNSDINSLNGMNGVTQLHYNATTTATPRDSLNSSQGRSNSGSGSTSTTNERQALCGGNRANQIGRQPPQQQLQERQVSSQITDVKSLAAKTDSSAVMHQAIGQKKQLRSQIGANTGNNTSHSTFGAFKEVTTYTDHTIHQQPKQQQQQTIATSQVNKIASQFDAKHQAQSRNSQNQIYVQNNHSSPVQQPSNKQQHNNNRQRIVVHSNGVDVNHGIIKAPVNITTEPQQVIASQGKMTNFAVKQSPYNKSFNNVNQQTQQLYPTDQLTVDQNRTVENFETNLSKLSILNLETTEL